MSLNKIFFQFILAFLMLSFSVFQVSAQDSTTLQISNPQWQGYMRPGFWARNGSSVGYLDYFLPIWQDEDSLLFVNPKLSFTDDDANEQNFGFGFRRYYEDEEMILGANLYYDSRQSTHFNRFNQVGVGVEILSELIDFRFNYYHPTTAAASIPELDRVELSLNGLLQLRAFEEPLRGLDYEVGFLLPVISDVIETRIYGGGFYYESDKVSRNPQGGRLRLEVHPNRLMTFEVKTDYDIDTGSETSIGGYFTLPFEIGNIFQGKNPFEGWRDRFGLAKGTRKFKDRMTERVVRDIDIVSEQSDVVDNTILDLIYVDNTNTNDPLENGDINHPYNTLAEALADTRHTSDEFSVYVKKGDGTATGQTGSYTLTKNTTLWGSGYNGGYKDLDSVTDAANPPVLDGGGSDESEEATVEATTNNTIQGLKFQNEDTAITAPNPGTLTIRNNTVLNSGLTALEVVLTTAGHTVNILNNTVTDAEDAGGEDPSGINVLVNAAGSGTVTITGNTVSSSDGGIFLQVLPGDFGGNPTGTVTATISNNTVSATNTNSGIEVHSGNTSTVNTTISNNTISGSGSHGISLQAYETSTMTTTISSNTISSSAVNGINVSTAETGPTITSTISNNSSTNNTQDGLNVNVVDASTQTATISGNTFNGNKVTGESGIQFGNVSGTLTAVLSTNNLIGNGYGLSINGIGLGGTGTDLDMGDGSNGSIGNNRIFSSELADVEVGQYTLDVQNSYYGGGVATTALTNGGAVSNNTTAKVLTVDPNP